MNKDDCRKGPMNPIASHEWVGMLPGLPPGREMSESRRWLQWLISETPVPAMIHAEDGEVLQVNRVWEAQTGYTRQLLPTLRQWASITEVGNAPEGSQGFNRLFSSDAGFPTEEVWLRTKDGRCLVWEISSAELGRLSDGRRVIITTAVDLTDRRRVEDELRKREADFRRLIESSVDAILVVDTEGTVMFVNPAAENLFERRASDFVGRDFGFPLVGGDFVEIEIPRKRGGLAVVEMRVVETEWEDKAAFLATLRDVTEQRAMADERKKTEIHLRQAQKMEAIGALAGGIAHDFNNILTIILGYTELAITSPDDPVMVNGYLKEALTAGRRAKDLVQQILAFSRETEQENRPIQVLSLVNETLKLLRASIPSNVEIQKRLMTDALILGDPTRIHQILMNLCTNAAHAMQKDGGTLTVSLEEATCRPSAGDTEEKDPMFCFPVSAEEKAGNEFVRMSVSDTGHGIPESIRERIFDPYFSTKKRGEGTGLGLALVVGLVKSLGGTIGVESTVGKGSTFSVYLPVLQKSFQPKNTEFEAVTGGSERILLVDDEEAIVKMTQKTLESLGYKVDSRISSLEALALFQARPNRFDLVITDMTMPKLTGDRLARRILAIRSDIPIILCSGYSEMMDEKKAKAAGIRAFVMKPLIRKELAGIIRSVLDRPEAGDGG